MTQQDKTGLSESQIKTGLDSWSATSGNIPKAGLSAATSTSPTDGTSAYASETPTDISKFAGGSVDAAAALTAEAREALRTSTLKISEEWGFTDRETARVTGAAPEIMAGWRVDHLSQLPTPDTARAMIDLVSCFVLLHVVLKGDKVAMASWLTGPNAELDNMLPRDILIQQGPSGVVRVRDYLTRYQRR